MKKRDEIRTDRMEDYLKVIYEKCRGLRLTEAGMRKAQNVREKHSLFAEFLKMIEVKDEIAHVDAEVIEHYLHPQTIKRLQKLIPILEKK